MASAHVDRIRDILGPTGLLSERLSGYRHRPQQQAMAEAVAAALGTGETLICEASTGTGKTSSPTWSRPCSRGARSWPPPRPAICRTSSSTATCPWCAKS